MQLLLWSAILSWSDELSEPMQWSATDYNYHLTMAPVREGDSSLHHWPTLQWLNWIIILPRPSPKRLSLVSRSMNDETVWSCALTSLFKLSMNIPYSIIHSNRTMQNHEWHTPSPVYGWPCDETHYSQLVLNSAGCWTSICLPPHIFKMHTC